MTFKFNGIGPAGPDGAPPITQHCYVTDDLDAAKETLRTVYGIEECFEILDNMVPHADGGFAHTNVLLAWLGNIQIEVIQPLGGRDEIYREYLQPGGPPLVFHHECKLARTWDEFVSERQRFVDLGCEIGFSRTSGPYRTFYADTRRFLGHFVEYVWVEDESTLVMGGKIPAY